MDVVLLSRLQFAIAVFFHFIFVPLTLGITVLIAYMETKYVRTGDETYKHLAKYWGKLFLINFVLGVVTGITLEFQFGTNWSRYSAFVGDIFGSLLAIEATAAFFLESTFVGVWAFGWDRVSKKTHCLAIWMVAFATNISAVWILLANGFMHHPVGYVLNNGRAELSSFLEVITNPYGWGQIGHTLASSWMLAGFFVIGVSAWHLIRKQHKDFFTKSLKIAAPFTLVLSLLVLGMGHFQGMNVAEYQPAKMAAMEAHWETQESAPMHVLTWPNQAEGRNYFEWIKIPGLLSLMAFNDINAEVTGLNDFAPEDIPNVAMTFVSFRFMVAMGVLFILLAAAVWLKRRDITRLPWLGKVLPWVIPLPYIAIAAGWMLAEVGRQPWIVYGLMRTVDGVSPVPASSVLTSIIAFIVIYTLLGILDIYLLIKYSRKGPDLPPELPDNQADALSEDQSSEPANTVKEA